MPVTHTEPRSVVVSASASRPTSWLSQQMLRRFLIVLAYAVMLALAALMLFPYFFMVVNSVKPRELFYTRPYDVILEAFTLEPYIQAMTIGRVGIYLRNSFLYSAAVVLAQLVIDSLAAFAFARLRFPGRDALFALFLATMMLPHSVLLIPSYMLVRSFGLADTYLGVVLPSFAGVFGIFMLRQFFLNIPAELEDAARIDGAGLFRIYSTIIIPLAQPALITLALFLFMSEWSAYVWPLIILNDWDKYPLTVGIAMYRDQATIEWPNVMAASSLASFPLIGLFLLAQRYLIGGIAISGLKA